MKVTSIENIVFYHVVAFFFQVSDDPAPQPDVRPRCVAHRPTRTVPGRPRRCRPIAGTGRPDCRHLLRGRLSLEGIQYILMCNLLTRTVLNLVYYTVLNSFNFSSRRRGSEWEVLEGLKDGQRFDKRPEVFNGYLHKKRKWPLKGWHKVSSIC